MITKSQKAIFPQRARKPFFLKSHLAWWLFKFVTWKRQPTWYWVDLVNISWHWMCSFPQPFILPCDCLEWIMSWLICTLFLIQNHEILNFILPKANFLERVILRAMKHFLGFGQGLKTFPPLFELLAMRHRAQLLSDVAHSASLFHLPLPVVHKVRRVHTILCLLEV